MLKRMILTSLLFSAAAAPVLASDASFDARLPGPKVSERKEAESAAAKEPRGCQCQHVAPPSADLPTADGARNNS